MSALGCAKKRGSSTERGKKRKEERGALKAKLEAFSPSSIESSTTSQNTREKKKKKKEKRKGRRKKMREGGVLKSLDGQEPGRPPPRCQSSFEGKKEKGKGGKKRERIEVRQYPPYSHC